MLSLKTTMLTALLLTNSSVFALQALTDDSLSQATGQDGLTITLKDFAVSSQIIWTDTNGINAADGIVPAEVGITTSTPQPGAVVFGNGTAAGNMRTSSGDTVFTLDADGNAGAAFLNLNIKLPQNLLVNTGNVYVAGKNNGALVNQTKIMNDMTVELGNVNINVQLGNAPQGKFAQLSGSITNGLNVSGVGLIGATSGAQEYGIGMQRMTLRDTGQSDLTLDGTGISVTNSGLLITHSATKQVDILMQDVRVGNLANTSPTLGGVALLGLQLGGTTLTISGH